MSRRAAIDGQRGVSPGGPLMAPGWSLSIFLLLTVLLCAVLGYLLPADTAHLLARLSPAFDWREPADIALGAAAAFAAAGTQRWSPAASTTCFAAGAEPRKWASPPPSRSPFA